CARSLVCRRPPRWPPTRSFRSFGPEPCRSLACSSEAPDMINAAIVGLGWWGKTLVESLNAGPAASDDIRFVAGTTRTISPELKAFADAQKFRLADNLAAP